MIFRFGTYELDERRFELRGHGIPVPIQRLALETLFFLVQSGGRLVTKEELINGPWQGRAVTHGAVNQAIMLARRAVSTTGETWIATVHGKGFRFVAKVECIRDQVEQVPNAFYEYGMLLGKSAGDRLSVVER